MAARGRVLTQARALALALSAAVEAALAADAEQYAMATAALGLVDEARLGS